MPATYFDGDQAKNLQEVNDKTCNGFIVLFDIKNSTRRKKEYENKWTEHTRHLYRAFTKFCHDVAISDELELTAIKFKGDGLMSFFKTTSCKATSSNNAPKPDLALMVLGKVLAFRDDVHVEMDDLLCGLRLKTVVSHITEVHPIPGETGATGDVLGQGVDFAHRLEQYGDASHIVVDDVFFRVLCPDGRRELKVEDRGRPWRLDGVPCEKALKGWDKPHAFWLLTNEEQIEPIFKDLPASLYGSDAVPELFRYYIKRKGSAPPIAEELQVDEWGAK